MSDTAVNIIGTLVIVAVVASRFWLDWYMEIGQERGGCNHDNPPHAKFCRRCGAVREPWRTRQ